MTCVPGGHNRLSLGAICVPSRGAAGLTLRSLAPGVQGLCCICCLLGFDDLAFIRGQHSGAYPEFAHSSGAHTLLLRKPDGSVKPSENLLWGQNTRKQASGPWEEGALSPFGQYKPDKRLHLPVHIGAKLRA